MLKIVFVPASERQEHRHCVPEEQHSRTNAPKKRDSHTSWPITATGGARPFPHPRQ